MATSHRPGARTGRGAVSNPEGRFDSTRTQAVDDGWGSLEEPLPPLDTIVRPDPARSIISRNQSPDISFSQSINPYRGCEHGCIYCYARPSHGYLNLSPGLDFETKLFYKQDAARLLEAELAAPGYRCSPITIGAIRLAVISWGFFGTETIARTARSAAVPPSGRGRSAP